MVAVGVSPVSENESVRSQFAPYRVDSRPESWIGGGQESDERHQQAAGVKFIAVVRLRECLFLGAPRAGEYVRPDLVSERAPAIDGARLSKLFVKADGTVKSDPGHYFRMGEVPIRPTYLPYTGVLFPPSRLEPAEQRL